MKQMSWERTDCPGITGTQRVPNKPVTLDVYVPDVIREDGRKRPGVLILPGGGYAFCSVTEAEPIALQFAARGYVAGVLYYRTQGFEERRYQDAMLPDVMNDVFWATQHLVDIADDVALDCKKLGILGFSAGGHLAAMAAFAGLNCLPEAERHFPTFDFKYVVLSYPVLSPYEPYAHVGSIQNLLSKDVIETSERQVVDPMQYVQASSPTAFIWSTSDDQGVPVQNALSLGIKLADHDIPYELHVYPHGPHGLALAHPSTGNVNNSAAVWITSALKWTDKVTGWDQ